MDMNGTVVNIYTVCGKSQLWVKNIPSSPTLTSSYLKKSYHVQVLPAKIHRYLYVYRKHDMGQCGPISCLRVCTFHFAEKLVRKVKSAKGSMFYVLQT